MNPKNKSFDVGSGGFRKIITLLEFVHEMDKCIVVCSNCHTELHTGVTVLPTNISEPFSSCFLDDDFLTMDKIVRKCEE
jgi:hypothetical protein